MRSKGKQPAAKKVSTKPFDKWASQDYINMRKRDPYLVPRAARFTNPEFYNSQMERIFSDCYTGGKYKVVEQRFLNIEVLRSNPSYFGGALEMCEELNLLPIMTFHCAYDEHLICQFYSTVHFTTTLPQKVKWMTKNKVLEATWSEFGQILGYPQSDIADENGWRCHDTGLAMGKEVLVPLYQEGAPFTAGKTEGLQKDYGILHRVFRETISAKTGNFDEMHGFTVDLMFRSYANRGKGLKLDVMDYLLHEMSQAMFDRRVPPYAPYIQALINATWAKTVGTCITDDLHLTTHMVKGLRIKAKHLAPPFVPAPEGADDPEGGAHGGDGSPHSARVSPAGTHDSHEVSVDVPIKKPSWFDQLMRKMKKSFCLKLEL
jgi:hypothetical protein